ncbi:MAG TPA: hypothetical protein VF909_11015, partial [Roseiflexaceae bacterium]
MNQDLPIPTTAVAGGLSAEVRAYRSPAAQSWRRFWRDPGAIAGALIVTLLACMAVFAPLIAPYDPAEQFNDGLTLQGLPVPSTLLSSERFILGTDPSGRDMF